MIEKPTQLFYVLLLVFGLSFGATVFHYANQDTGPESTAPSLFQKGGIGLLTITGPISAEGASSGFRPKGFLTTLDKINAFEKNESIQAVVVRINSPGGTVGASQEIYHALRRLKKNRQIPIIVSMGDVAASGGFWIAMAGDEIFANPGTLVGNIGVIMQAVNLEEATEKLGIDVTVYKSGPYKDLLSSFRPTTESEKELVQAMITDIYEQFIKVVMVGRDMNREQVERVSDGRIFTGLQALDAGLVDRLGGLDLAVSYAGKKAGLGEDPRIIGQEQPGIDWFFQMLQQQGQSLFSAIFQSISLSNQPALQLK